jgi:hypothetical protein
MSDKASLPHFVQIGEENAVTARALWEQNGL